jgi:hypothetical protein
VYESERERRKNNLFKLKNVSTSHITNIYIKSAFIVRHPNEFHRNWKICLIVPYISARKRAPRILWAKAGAPI